MLLLNSSPLSVSYLWCSEGNNAFFKDYSGNGFSLFIGSEKTNSRKAINKYLNPLSDTYFTIVYMCLNILPHTVLDVLQLYLFTHSNPSIALPLVISKL